MKKVTEGWIRLLTLVGALAVGVSLWGGQPATSAAQTEAAEAAEQAPSGVVNLNTATVEELTRLPGIGQSKAEAIVALRERHGQFRRVEQVLHVRGIGRATFRRLRPMLAVDGETTLAR